MSLLFHQKSRRVIKVVFSILAVLIMVSMVLLYVPNLHF